MEPGRALRALEAPVSQSRQRNVKRKYDFLIQEEVSQYYEVI